MAVVSLGTLARWDAACVVDDDPGCVVRRARPITEQDRETMRAQHEEMRTWRLEQAIMRMAYDFEAVRVRERRIAIERGRLAQIRRRA